MLDFVHRENVRRFEKALATCEDAHERATLIRLIAEEKAKLEDALRLMAVSVSDANTSSEKRE